MIEYHSTLSVKHDVLISTDLAQRKSRADFVVQDIPLEGQNAIQSHPEFGQRNSATTASISFFEKSPTLVDVLLSHLNSEGYIASNNAISAACRSALSGSFEFDIAGDNENQTKISEQRKDSGFDL